MNLKLNKLFNTVIVNSLNTQQINFLGESIDREFNVYKISGINQSIPIQRQTAAETLLYYFKEEDQIVELFAFMLYHEGERFYNRELSIWGKDEFLQELHRLKWIYDPDLHHFFRDPFYAREINFLKKLRVIDLRGEVDVEETIHTVAEMVKRMSIRDLEWRIAMQMYDIDRKSGELIRKILDMLLTRQNLTAVSGEMFVCLKELVINASKANYKRLFEKHVTREHGLTSENNYPKFLEVFRSEIEVSGNSRLIEFARQDDRYVSVTFQSATDFIEIWVTNNLTVSAIEKEQIYAKIAGSAADSFMADDEYAEGAGLGLNIVMNVLNKYSRDKEPLKVVFYPDSIKIGFVLKRADIAAPN
jgi:hypothetical protein